ncbi:hypothetical protein RJZ56_004670 [Blastomyces dermatitidis]|uniref:DNL zinc finger domain-containing protein n=2 Tax=Ajellomyces dermatitidis TaxID=5039 RepID=F2TU32_AJEDA|nr:DNL zinc finger domain-containing protein [Blastomyces dermatitidis ER-3]XP_045282255.1 DNL zinc finger domain-containing protein, variant 1 [Blastomyces dermatitidis ER-3]XP_045282256.1 DNL zinc finger domain-containing protein, variant 2 [Blastomyces dermatitidis ER-3]XP_045282257.1 DNL zinc finger domain-containing protein, variant 3 [Blastomyces dermatitidis ER-3]EGE86745.1 DNL zinc finger domain-containing protein [Blastomyces dermatitidis ATCC 18188]EQL30397.1 hypothetical protein BDF
MASSRRLVQSLATRANHSSLTSQSSRTQSFISSRIRPFTASRLPACRPNPPPLLSSQFCRYNTTSTRPPKPLTDSKPATPEDAAQNARRRAEERAFQITFTCKPCGHRSSHRISQHGYYKGTVLISCPGCKNRHVISDHLNIFMDKKSTLEDILSEHGQTLLKGKLDGDMEWWEDGTVRAVASGPASDVQGQTGQTAQQQDNAGVAQGQERTQEQKQEPDEIKQPGHR